MWSRRRARRSRKASRGCVPHPRSRERNAPPYATARCPAAVLRCRSGMVTSSLRGRQRSAEETCREPAQRALPGRARPAISAAALRVEWISGRPVHGFRPFSSSDDMFAVAPRHRSRATRPIAWRFSAAVVGRRLKPEGDGRAGGGAPVAAAQALVADRAVGLGPATLAVPELDAAASRSSPVHRRPTAAGSRATRAGQAAAPRARSAYAVSEARCPSSGRARADRDGGRREVGGALSRASRYTRIAIRGGQRTRGPASSSRGTLSFTGGSRSRRSSRRWTTSSCTAPGHLRVPNHSPRSGALVAESPARLARGCATGCASTARNCYRSCRPVP